MRKSKGFLSKIEYSSTLSKNLEPKSFDPLKQKSCKNRKITSIGDNFEDFSRFSFSKIIEASIVSIESENFVKFNLFENMSELYLNEYKKRSFGFLSEKAINSISILDREYDIAISRIDSEIHNRIYMFLIYANTAAAHEKIISSRSRNGVMTSFIKLNFEKLSDNIRNMGLRAKTFMLLNQNFSYYPTELERFSSYISPQEFKNVEDIEYKHLKKTIEFISTLTKTWITENNEDYARNKKRLELAEDILDDANFPDILDEYLRNTLHLYKINFEYNIASYDKNVPQYH